jgi:hypothetical protein
MCPISRQSFGPSLLKLRRGALAILLQISLSILFDKGPYNVQVPLPLQLIFDLISGPRLAYGSNVDDQRTITDFIMDRRN